MASRTKKQKATRGNRDAKQLERKRKRQAKERAKAIAEGKTIEI